MSSSSRPVSKKRKDESTPATAVQAVKQTSLSINMASPTFYQAKNAQGDRISYLMALEIICHDQSPSTNQPLKPTGPLPTRTKATHPSTGALATAIFWQYVIKVGDLCAVRYTPSCPHPFTSMPHDLILPFNSPAKEPWQVGQILALFACKNAKTTSLGSSTEPSQAIPTLNTASTNAGSITTYHAVVRWLWHYKTPPAQHVLTKAHIHQIRQKSRPEHFLLETTHVQVVPCTDLLPCTVQLRPSSTFNRKLVPATQVEPQNTWIWLGHCKYRIEPSSSSSSSSPTGTEGADSTLWNLVENHSFTEFQVPSPGRNCPVPPALQRGWHWLQQQIPRLGLVDCLPQLLTTQWPVWLATTQSDPAPRVSIITPQLPLPDPPVPVPTKTATQGRSSTSKLVEVTNKKKSRKTTSTITKRKKPLIESLDIAEQQTVGENQPAAPGKANDRVSLSRKRPTATNQSKAPVATKRSRVQSLATSEVHSTEATTASSTAGTSTVAVDPQDGEDQNEQLSLTTFLVQPFPQIVYKGKASKGEPSFFYEGVELSLPRQASIRKYQSRISTMWTVRVGDLIAVATSDNYHNSRSSSDWKNPWYPYRLPWSPAQVTAIFHLYPGHENKTASAANGDEVLFMQVRWFQRLADIDPVTWSETPLSIRSELERGDCPWTSRKVVEVDEYLSQVDVRRALGRVILTSEAEPGASWFQNALGEDGIPQAPMVCRVAHRSQFDSHLEPIHDWSSYGSKMAGPLTRCLQCPKSWPGKISRLCKAYEGCLRKRFNVLDKLEDGFPDNAQTKHSKSDASSWPPELLTTTVTSSASGLICRHVVSGGSGRTFFRTAAVTFDPKRCDQRVTAKKSNHSDLDWTINCGDLISVACHDATAPSEKKPWFPFMGPWRLCQVLTVYQDTAVPESEVMLEVRWFLRRVELPLHLQQSIPKACNDRLNEVFESDLVANVPASFSLGRAELVLGGSTQTSLASKKADQVPTVVYRCRTMYFSSRQVAQPIFFFGSHPGFWMLHLRKRGFGHSVLAKDCQELKAAVQAFVDDSTAQLENQRHTDPFSGMTKLVAESPDAECPFHQAKISKGVVQRYYLCTNLSPQWSSYCEADAICDPLNRRDLTWKVSVGDLVIVRAKTTSGLNFDYYPFNARWKVAQVIEIFDFGNQTIDKRFCLRWFNRSHEALSLETAFPRKGPDLLYETDATAIETFEASALLAPVVLLSPSQSGIDRTSWEQFPAFVPMMPFSYLGKLEGEGDSTRNLHSKQLQQIKAHAANFTRMETEGVVKLKRMLEPTELFPLPLDQSSHDENGRDNVRHAYSWTETEPIYSDKSTAIDFFEELCMNPDYDLFATDKKPIDNGRVYWKVRLGDPVILHYKYCSGKTSFGVESGLRNDRAYFPFRIPWGVGEVVTIFRGKNSSRRLMLEIRWLYRANELPGVADKDAEPGLACEEILESDHYDECPSTSLLAPALLVAKQQLAAAATYHLGMPVVSFLCRRFWSVYRKCLLPIGDPKGRMRRALVNSKYMTKYKELRAYVEKIHLEPSANKISVSIELKERPQRVPDWKDAFKAVIENLSLTAASKEAYESSSALIGRQKEISQVRKFLYGAITGHSDVSNKATLFVAGPPGVGKTACIRAAVNEIRVDHTDANLPAFDFVALNGMEMRDPVEAYVRLWEAVSPSKSRCGPETARTYLEAYFCPLKKFSCKQEASRIVVVLLDEIDYLVTSNQSVIFNFFHWPTRCIECSSPIRLIVVGVSNTLNLPEQLHPRVQSRLGSHRIYFSAYNVDETVAILKAKISRASPRYKVFDDNAIELAAKKTAKFSGDIRKAFQICRTSAETLMNDAPKDDADTHPVMVRCKDILRVSRDSFNSALSRRISFCTSLEALLLVSLASLSKSTGREVGGFDVEELLTKMRAISNAFGDRSYHPPPSFPETLGMLSRLYESNLLSLDTTRDGYVNSRSSLGGNSGSWPSITLLVDEIELLVALKQTRHAELANKYLCPSM